MFLNTGINIWESVQSEWRVQEQGKIIGPLACSWILCLMSEAQIGGKKYDLSPLLSLHKVLVFPNKIKYQRIK